MKLTKTQLTEFKVEYVHLLVEMIRRDNPHNYSKYLKRLNEIDESLKYRNNLRTVITVSVEKR